MIQRSAKRGKINKKKHNNMNGRQKRDYRIAPNKGLEAFIPDKHEIRSPFFMRNLYILYNSSFSLPCEGEEGERYSRKGGNE